MSDFCAFRKHMKQSDSLVRRPPVRSAKFGYNVRRCHRTVCLCMRFFWHCPFICRLKGINQYDEHKSKITNKL